MPTYPFQRTRYWLPVPDRDRSAGRAVSELLHRFAWPETPLPAGVIMTSVGLIGAPSGLVEALTQRLARRGVAVHPRPATALDELPPTSVVVLFAGTSVDLDDVDTLDKLTRSASETVLPLARFLAQRPTPLVVITEDLALTGAATERGRPGQAVLAGLARSLPEENPDQPVRLVDLSTLDDEAARLDAVIRELDAPPVPGPAESVAWRSGRRLSRTPQLQPVGAPDRPTLPLSGCYLITGGAGGIGAALARALANRGAARLYLVGRAADCAEGLLERLSSLGAASARYLCADVSVQGDVQQARGGAAPAGRRVSRGRAARAHASHHGHGPRRRGRLRREGAGYLPAGPRAGPRRQPSRNLRHLVLHRFSPAGLRRRAGLRTPPPAPSSTPSPQRSGMPAGRCRC